MNERFNADEILEIAQQIERNGARFYRRAAEAPLTPKLRRVLLDLAAMEEQHEQTFARMQADLSGKDWATTALDRDGEAALYLRAVAGGRVFGPDPSERLTGKEDIKDVFQTAIGLEKDSIVFYLAIKQMVPEDLGRSKVEDIIREEMGHIVTLTGQFAGV